jgi:hypothetical protein
VAKHGGHVSLSGALRVVFVTAALGVVSGCVNSPTYGTGKPADVQLLEDVTGMMSIMPNKKEPIEYKPRPTLVQPPTKDTLPPPQESVASASNPSWPESPEQRRARIRDEATQNRDNPEFEPAVATASSRSAPQLRSQRTRGDDLDANGHVTVASAASTEGQRAEFKRLRDTKQGSATTRTFLSEPPLEYRVPAETAPTDELGEDEWKKERRRKVEARRNSGNSSWRDLVPWL